MQTCCFHLERMNVVGALYSKNPPLLTTIMEIQGHECSQSALPRSDERNLCAASRTKHSYHGLDTATHRSGTQGAGEGGNLWSII
ncbi:hypothetical protein Y1Q_0011063 [Alligator mississippiensis]|uniref:Uncharacterized protein n=1 Tax=Alligator mississippiensis TaxID=8496 RepID=A0A151NWW2_ALLMI|nr:hypothetical protein Y1Q_0011063 [Alligator mississippiensis]